MLPPWWIEERREEPIPDPTDERVSWLFMSTLPELDVFAEECVPYGSSNPRGPERTSFKVRNDYGLGWPRSAANTKRYVRRCGRVETDNLWLWPVEIDDRGPDDAGTIGCAGGPDVWSFGSFLADDLRHVPMDHNRWSRDRVTTFVLMQHPDPIVDRGNRITLTNANEQRYHDRALRMQARRDVRDDDREQVFEGPNGTPRPRRDVSPNSRLRAPLVDVARVEQRGRRR